MKRDLNRRPLLVFFSYFAPYRGLFALDMLCATAVSAVDLVFPTRVCHFPVVGA